MSYSGNSNWLTINSSTVGIDNLEFGDFNGDGITDVFTHDAGEWLVSYSGTSAWTHLNTSSYGLGEIRFGDFDGDNITDVFRTENN